ncbi:LemA family protein [Ramlibacter sp. AW1]|uniref:LemA family protein n=1 Tax=Ramlibacter aurantiacus TaxID=2801330 RepID=A0A936ZSF4_9BURK|nr:LemA family protein [Ramlibacter aurantiacus]MBL0422613.1 LemA family protein [Ramlibacter aurantiacus]
MTRSVLFWAAAAVLLFWAIGAYNRLVRLRADVKTAFAQLDAQLQQEVRLVESLLAGDAPDSLFPGEGQPSFWEALHGAAIQLAATLALARARPLEKDRIEALAAADGVLRMAWERVEREDAHDLAGPRLPDTLAATRMQLLVQVRAGVDAFNDAVIRYNQAVAQFPAALLAWIFGFKAGRVL